MAHRGQVLDNGRLTFLTTAKDSDGAA